MKQPVVERLVRGAVEVSKCVTSLLVACERVHARSNSRGSQPQEAFLNVDEILSEAAPELSKWAAGAGRYVTMDKEWEQRLARLVLSNWSAQVSEGAARRPDVLAITAEMLSSAEAPHTYDTVRFAIVLALRSLYDAPFTTESLQEIRSTYDSLSTRFKQQRRRQRHTSNSFENLLIDVLCLDGWIHRSLTPVENRDAYYRGFFDFPLGVTSARRRAFAADVGSGPRRPELTGSVPDFGTLINLLFTQPTGVAGLDDVTGGLLSTVAAPPREWTGGLVTLVAGPPGSGKTSLCLSITSKMAQLGSTVRYIATEEEAHSLRAKLTTFAESETVAFDQSDDSAEPGDKGDFAIIDGVSFGNLEALTEQLKADFESIPQERVPRSEGADGSVDLYLVFPRVIVLDSLTALLQAPASVEGTSTNEPRDRLIAGSRRRMLGRTLNTFRELGVCVFLVGGKEDATDETLGYLVDNIFTLDLETESSNRHPVRTLTVGKTRLQTSHRGRHVFHLSRTEGCSVSPSLHSVLRSLKSRHVVPTDPNKRAIVWSNNARETPQITLPGVGASAEAVTLRAHSQVLVYGRGSSGKARFGISIALEPRIPTSPTDRWQTYLDRHGDKERELTTLEKFALATSRLLVISFLYTSGYYEALASDFFHQRFRIPRRESQSRVRDQVSILDFHPGFVDPETVVGMVRRRLRGARLEGRPFTAVLIDGVHNLLVQFPLLEHEPLLWPTLYRLLRTEGVESVTTFTFFEMARFRSRVSQSGRAVPQPADNPDTVELRLAGSEQLFFHLLVSSCDYTFLVEKPPIPLAGKRPWIRVRLASSADIGTGGPEEYWWDPQELRYRQLD